MSYPQKVPCFCPRMTGAKSSGCSEFHFYSPVLFHAAAMMKTKIYQFAYVVDCTMDVDKRQFWAIDLAKAHHQLLHHINYSHCFVVHCHHIPKSIFIGIVDFWDYQLCSVSKSFMNFGTKQGSVVLSSNIVVHCHYYCCWNIFSPFLWECDRWEKALVGCGKVLLPVVGQNVQEGWLNFSPTKFQIFLSMAVQIPGTKIGAFSRGTRLLWFVIKVEA